MQKLKKGDTVTVLSGRDAGKTAAVDRVLTKEGLVFITAANLVKRHVRKMGNIEGGIIDIPKPMPLSKVGLVCPNCKKVTRAGIEIEGDGKYRFCKKCRKRI